MWLPAAVAHAHQAYGATQLRTVAFPVDADPFGLIWPVVLSVSRLLRELIIAITDDPPRPPGEQDDLRRVVLHQLRRPALGPALQFHLPQPADERLRDVTAILAGDPGSDRTLAELGRAVGAGERTLSRLFRAETGMTFPQWRAQLRLHHSLTLLATGRSVTATAMTCGYSTPSAFTAAFHATFGTTPGSLPQRPDPFCARLTICPAAAASGARRQRSRAAARPSPRTPAAAPAPRAPGQPRHRPGNNHDDGASRCPEPRRWSIAVVPVPRSRHRNADQAHHEHHPPRGPGTHSSRATPAPARDGGGPWRGYRIPACHTSGGWRSC